MEPNATVDNAGDSADTFVILQDSLEEFNDGYSDNTRLSLESQDFDSNQGTLSSESVEPIHENFQDMGIDNWHDAADHFPPPLACNLGDVPGDLDRCNQLPCTDSEMAETPLESSVSNNMQLVLYVPPSDNTQQTKEKQALPGSCGLGNIGNTCYMNAGLQCLTATKPLVQFFVSNWSEQAYVSSPAAYQNDNTGVLTYSFAQLITKMWSGKFRMISPSEFKRSLGQRHIQFKDSRQHDCQEFLALLLDTLHEQLNIAGKCSAMVPLQGLPAKSCKEEAVAGCSRQKSVQPLREGQPLVRQLSPGRSSNIDVAKQLAKRHADQVEKNHLERTRQSSQSPVAVASSLPIAVISPSLSVYNLGATNPSLLKNIAIQDYFKEAKTSNVNVLSPLQRSESRPNNEIKFDSEKFGSSRLSLSGAAAAVSPRGIRSLGPRDPVLVENPNNLGEECSEKDESSSLLHEPLHKKLKQTNLEQRQPCSSASNSAFLGSAAEVFDYGDVEQESTYKKLKLVTSHIKNKEEEDEDGGVEMESSSEQRGDEEDEDDLTQQEASAQAHWDQHLVLNQSVIVDTFQGQFRSTVVCSICHHKSVTFEPFMYLSVPLPHAMELQLEVTYVPANPDLPALRFLVNMHRMATAEQLREEVRRLAAAEPDSDLAVCESMEHRVSKVLHPPDLIEKSPRDRVFYVIEVPKLDWLEAEQMRLDEPPDLIKEASMEVSEDYSFIGPMTHEAFLKGYPSSNVTPPPPSLRHQDEESLPWPKCNICLEEVEISSMPLKHGEDCECVLCASCLQECKTHQAKSESTLKCPVCHLEVDPDVDFVVMTTINSNCKPSKWMLTVPVVFRVDEEGAEYNNLRTSKLYGHPRLLHLPSKITGSQLYECLQPYSPNEDFTLLQVGGNGLLCSECLFNSHCKGCAISSSSLVEIELQPNSMLAVRTSRLPEEPLPMTMEHKSFQKQQKRKEEKLSLYDCLDAFTKPETLDSENPWFCPNCKQNQCATKTISVWRYPPVVIIYLKRFVFHEGRSIKLDNKVAFPLKGLHLKESALGNKHTSSLYDLYSCVCHIGGTTGSGHYMAYTRHPLSQEWYRYNDSSVLRQRPEVEDHNQAYVLFYQRCDLDTAPAVL